MEATKKKPTKKHIKQEDNLKVKGSFLDIIKASVKDANAKVSKKKKNLPKS